MHLFWTTLKECIYHFIACLIPICDFSANVIVSIECRAWAENIEYHGGSLNRAGSVTFEVQVDAETHSHKQNNLTTEHSPQSTITSSTTEVNRTTAI